MDQKKRVVDIQEFQSNPGIREVMHALEHSYDSRPIALVFWTSDGFQMIRLNGLEYLPCSRPGIFKFTGYLLNPTDALGEQKVTGDYDANKGEGGYSIEPRS